MRSLTSARSSSVGTNRGIPPLEGSFAFALLTMWPRAHHHVHDIVVPVEIAGTRPPTLPASVSTHIDAHPSFLAEGHRFTSDRRSLMANVGARHRVIHPA